MHHWDIEDSAATRPFCELSCSHICAKQWRSIYSKAWTNIRLSARVRVPMGNNRFIRWVTGCRQCQLFLLSAQLPKFSLKSLVVNRCLFMKSHLKLWTLQVTKCGKSVSSSCPDSHYSLPPKQGHTEIVRLCGGYQSSTVAQISSAEVKSLPLLVLAGMDITCTKVGCPSIF